MTRARVAGAIGMADSVPLSTRDTVLWETPAASAMSLMVTIRVDPSDRAARLASLAPLNVDLPRARRLCREALTAYH